MISKSVTRSFIFAAAAAAAAVVPVKQASATVGQLPLCIGTYKCGMAGAGLTIASDPTAATMNPALSARMGNSAIISAGWFHADVERDLSPAASANVNPAGQQTSRASDFFNGSMGINYALENDMTVNVSVYPGGGGATDWDDSRTGGGGGAGDTSQDRQIRWRMFNAQIATAFSPNKTSSYGFGLVLTRADMKTNALDNTFGIAPDPQVVDVAYGAGFNIGGVWDLSDKMTVAADYQSKIWVERFDKYPSQFNSTLGRPATVSIGLDFDVRDDTVVALDGKFIHEGSIRSVSSQPSADGGFGWDDIFVVMLGVENQTTENLKLRAGISYNTSPIDDTHVFANVLLPAIITSHYTVGGTYTMDEFEFGLSAYVTGKNKLTEQGTGDGFSQMGKDVWLSHQQFGSQLSVKYNF
ncbi:MAG: OmpP1/FadL family transporter [Alphaproteobacteria bacterium]